MKKETELKKWQSRKEVFYTYGIYADDDTKERLRTSEPGIRGIQTSGIDWPDAQRKSFVNDRERGIYTYLYNTKGRGEAEKYIKSIETTLNERMAADQRKRDIKYAENHPAAATIRTVAESPGTGVSAFSGTVKNAASDMVTGKNQKLDVNAPYFEGVRRRSDTVGTVTKDMNGLGSFLYETGLSMGDMVMTLPLAALSEPLSLAVMSSNAAASAAYDATLRGADSKTALAMGTAYGAVEFVTEKIGLDNLFKIAKTPAKTKKAVISAIAKQMSAEGIEEIIAEVADNIIDTAVMGDESTYSQTVKEYTAAGYGYDESRMKAVVDLYGKNVLLAGAGGALSGGVFGTGAAVGSHIKYNNHISVESDKAAREAADAVLKSFGELKDRSGIQAANKGALVKERFDGSFLKAYTDAAASGLESRNSAVYRDFSEKGIDISQALYDYFTTTERNSITDSVAFQAVVSRLKPIIEGSARRINTVNNNMGFKNETFNRQAEAIARGDFSVFADNETGNMRGAENAADGAESSDINYLTENDTEDYLNTGNKHTRDRKEDLIGRGEKAVLTSKKETDDFIEKSLKGQNASKIKAFAKADGRMVNDIANKSDNVINISGYYLELNSDDIIHLSQHKAENKSGQIPLSEQDIKNIPEYLVNYDNVLDVKKKKDGRVAAIFGKKINGHSIVISLVSKGRKSLTVKTAYQLETSKYDEVFGNKKENADVRETTASYDDTMPDTPKHVPAALSDYKPAKQQTENVQALPLNVRNASSDTALFDNRIPQKKTVVNNQNKKEALRFLNAKSPKVTSETAAGDASEFNIPQKKTVVKSNDMQKSDNNAPEYAHLYDEKKVSKEYLNSVNEEIENAVINIRNGDLDSVPDVIDVTELAEHTAKAISELVGFDVSDYSCRIEKDAILHIENRHGINGKHDHSLSDPKDTARMGYVINNSDSVDWIKENDGSIKTSKKYKDKNNNPARLVIMQKKIDGTYCVSNVVPDSKNKTIWITSARIQKKHQDLDDNNVSPKTTSNNALDTFIADVGSQVPNADNSPQLTSETLLVSSSASDNSVSQDNDNVNNNSM